MHILGKLSFYLVVIFTVVSCTCKRQGNQPKKELDVKKSDVKIQIHRFEKDWYAMNPNQISSELKKLQQIHPMMFNAYYNFVMEFPRMGSEAQQDQIIKDFITKPNMVGLYDSVMKKYPNLDFLEEELTEAFINFKSYFPNKPIPKVYTCITEFAGFSAFTFGDSLLGICIDDFLGAKYVYYPNFFHDYQLYSLDKPFMTIQAMNVMATNQIDAPLPQSTLLDKMIIYGKILYFIESMLPKEKQENIIRYTKQQYEWCEQNQKQIWAYFLDKKLLYESKPDHIKYVEDAPSTYGMPETSPGRVGAWLGWQIIRNYMKNNPSTTLKQLIDNKESQKILEAANYKP